MSDVKNRPRMKDGACYPARMADMADDLSTVDELSRSDLYVCHVQVFGQKSPSMIENDHVPVIVKGAGKAHDAVVGRSDRRALGNVDVLPRMAGHRMSVQVPVGPEVVGHLSGKRKDEGTMEPEGRVRRGQCRMNDFTLATEAPQKRFRRSHEGAGHMEPRNLEGSGHHLKNKTGLPAILEINVHRKRAGGTREVDPHQSGQRMISPLRLLVPPRTKSNPVVLDRQILRMGFLREQEEKQPSLWKTQSLIVAPISRFRPLCRGIKYGQEKKKEERRKTRTAPTHGSRPV